MADENLPTIISEMSTIEPLMGDLSSSYWKGPHADWYQSRYRELAGKVEGQSPPSTATTGATNHLEILSPAEVGYDGPAYDDYLKLMRHSADVLHRMPEADQDAFVAAFEGLPDDVTGACMLELLRAKPSVSWASDDDAAHFRTNVAGGLIMSREWGQETRRNLAVCRARIWRVINDLDENCIPAFIRWLQGLSDAAGAAIYRKLAA